VLILSRDDEACEPAERRIGAALARFDLGVIKGFAVGRDQRAHHRMLGLMRLQIAVTDTGIAAGAPDHLMQKLERALGGAGIAVAQAEIGIDDADQIELREMMALGDKLGTDDDVEAAGGDVVELFAQPLDGGDKIAGEDQWQSDRSVPSHSMGNRERPSAGAACSPLELGAHYQAPRSEPIEQGPLNGHRLGPDRAVSIALFVVFDRVRSAPGSMHPLIKSGDDASSAGDR